MNVCLSEKYFMKKKKKTNTALILERLLNTFQNQEKLGTSTETKNMASKTELNKEMYQ